MVRSPRDGEVVLGATPVLVAGPAVDSDSPVLTYQFEILRLGRQGGGPVRIHMDRRPL